MLPESLLMESFPLLHNLQNETSFERLHGHQGDGRRDVAPVDADHVGVLVVTEVAHLLGLLVPRVPDDGVGEIVFLNPHFPPRHDVCDNVLVRRVDVNPETVFMIKYENKFLWKQTDATFCKC